MATSGRGSGVVGCNAQAAVETDHHLIIAHNVIQSGSERAPMAQKAKEALGVDEIDAVGDRGCFGSEQILECSRIDVTVTLPRPMTSCMKAKGQFGKQDFRYLADEDIYLCPAGRTLSFISHKRQSDGPGLRRNATTGCETCALKTGCTASAQRVVTRWEHKDMVEDVQRCLDENPQSKRQRRETVEHPFGSIKMRLGATLFLMKRLKNVKTEMALSVLAYNLSRAMNIVGIRPLIAAIRS